MYKGQFVLMRLGDIYIGTCTEYGSKSEADIISDSTLGTKVPSRLMLLC